MNTRHGSAREFMVPSIGITGCLQEYQQMRFGSVYWLSMDTHVNALRFATQTLAALDFNNRAVVVGSDKIPVIISALKEDQGPAELRSYSLRGEMPKAVVQLTKQLDRRLKPSKRLIVCLLPIESLSFLEKNTHIVLKNWRDWCEGNGCILLILAYGEQAQYMSLPLIAESVFLSGLGHLKTQENGYIYQLDYWVNNLGVQAAQQFFLQDKNIGYELLKTAALPVKKALGEVFLQRSVLEGAPVFMAEKWRIAEDWQGLVDAAQIVVRGTFVFALSENNELESLARTLYKLRQQRGLSISIVVREMKQVLRNQEVQLLLQCGAATVVSADTHLARFFGILENLKNQQSNQPLTHNLESAIAKIKAPDDIKGIVSVPEFTAYLKRVLMNASAVDAGGVLVAMRPAPALSVEQLMGQLRIDRQGDVACAANGVMHLFLFGCHQDFIEIALQRVFSLPMQDIVSEHQVHTEHVSIEDHVRRMQILNKTQANSTLEQVRENCLAVHPTQRSEKHDRRTSILFKPQLKPLNLRSQTQSEF
ncbi:hypothetical protein FXF61_14750 [Pseudomonas sp. C27(2019)]|uniref:BcsE family c-di-GMP-binding protein n=1 Tax=Pseudomonas sp. C27(2019) TaxID=2604941 RepID=UPI00124807A0|nr:BcsE family c-di-GMP-binding protein [Pseudomonas sp. C27(2019)]QEY57669.1 hypothetical protein FXF61_00060 [Pseudomonas sp. C27(2019)]QEY60321.1 hypothetical protein FXF61_14750 [Pseudomonas sp. C27(2019)]